MRNVYQYVYETFTKILQLMSNYVQFSNDPVDPNITRFRNSFEKFMSDDLEIVKPGKTLCVGWEEGIKEAAVFAMTKSDTVYDKVSESAKLIRKETKPSPINQNSASHLIKIVK